MKEELMTDALLRGFLLDTLDDDKREEIEGLFLTDSQVRDRVLTAEQDLIEEYLEDTLTKGEKERFLALYAQTEEQRRELRITKSIKEWAFKEALVSQPALAGSIWSRLSKRLRFKAMFIVPIAAMIVIAFVVVPVWLNRTTEQRRHQAVEQELAQLNSPTGTREVSPQITLELRPVTVRGAEPKTELISHANTQTVELRLLWIEPQRYATYEVELRRTGGDETYTIRNLQAEVDGAYVIRVKVPAHLLSPGQYQIQVKGLANDGTASPQEEYNFGVSA